MAFYVYYLFFWRKIRLKAKKKLNGERFQQQHSNFKDLSAKLVIKNSLIGQFVFDKHYVRKKNVPREKYQTLHSDFLFEINTIDS